MQEVTTVIEMPKFDSKKAAAFASGDYSRVVIPTVVAGLREYVTIISSMYHSNPFHNVRIHHQATVLVLSGLLPPFF